jgi:L-2-hydroxyglutarate oxidase LhgO
VVHSGLYYKPGSLKAKTCVAGAAEMAKFCEQYGLPFRRCGKVVVATEADELPRLEELYRRGTANGIAGLRMLDAQELRELEPHAAGIRALRVPSAAITDYGAVTRKMAELVRARGGELRLGARVSRLSERGDEVTAESTAGDFTVKMAVNCAGLQSDRLAQANSTGRREMVISPFRGEYYDLAPEAEGLVKGLMYPVPDPKFPFLGVHFTLKVHGGVEAGPNAVLALAREGYQRTDFNWRDVISTLSFPGFWRMSARYWRTGTAEYWRSLSKSSFLHALQRLLPELQREHLRPGGSGVRAQALDRNGKLLDDFYISRSRNIVHVGNVPSPAATASLVIGRQIVDLASSS